MQPYPEETAYAQRNLTSKPYREEVDKLEAELHTLSDELIDAKITVLEDRGYESMNISGDTLLVPKGITFEQLYTTLQQVPPDLNPQYKLTYLVKEEDRKAASNADVYQEIVARRQDIVDKIIATYEEFWVDEVQPMSDTEEESIVYMLAGMNQEIDSDILSDATDIPAKRWRDFEFDDNGIVVETNIL